MKILIDANVALDVLLERQPFYVSGVVVTPDELLSILIAP